MKNYLSTTKGNFRRTYKTKSRVTRLSVFSLIVVVTLWFFGNAFAYIGSYVFVPIRIVDTWLSESTASLPTFIRDRKTLIDEKNELLYIIELQKDADAEMTLLEGENKLLRELLFDVQGERIVAGVIGTPGELPYDTILIDKGAEDGILVGAVVYSGGDRVIGTVERIVNDSAIVVLATTQGVVSTAYVLGPDIFTTAVGIGGGVLQVSVPQGIDLSVGQLVILPGVSRGVFGRIEVIDPRPTRPAQYGYVQTGNPIQNTRLVSVGVEISSSISFKEALEVVREAKMEALKIPVPEETLTDAPQADETSTSTEITSPD